MLGHDKVNPKTQVKNRHSRDVSPESSFAFPGSFQTYQKWHRRDLRTRCSPDPNKNIPTECSAACLFPAARKCSVKDGYKKLKKKVAENCLDRNDSNMLLGTSFLIVSKSETDFANKVS